MKHLPLNQIELRSVLFQTRKRPQIFASQRYSQLWRNDLHVSAVDSGEGCAQNFVASHDFVDAPFQALSLDRRRQPARIEDIEKRKVEHHVLELAQPVRCDGSWPYTIFSRHADNC